MPDPVRQDALAAPWSADVIWSATMSIKDYSGWSDDQVPAWVRERREERRAAARYEALRLCGTCQRHFGLRTEVLEHCDETGHTLAMQDSGDKFLKRKDRA